MYCVDDAVPDETIELLRLSCDERRLDFIEVDAPSFDFDPDHQLGPGDMLFRPATSVAASRVEQFLYADGVATFYAGAMGPFVETSGEPLFFERCGLPVPRTIPCGSSDRDLLRAQVERLGDLPVVLKTFGGEGGVGVMRVDSFPALFSLVDYALSQGQNPLLSSYVEDALHWRVVVVGERAVAAYPNSPEPDDFRSAPEPDPEHYQHRVRAGLARLAIRAVQVLGLEFGGVDILEHHSGRLYLLEANFPCYYPQAQLAAGIDISGKMVAHLVKKARRMAREARRGR